MRAITQRGKGLSAAGVKKRGRTAEGRGEGRAQCQSRVIYCGRCRSKKEKTIGWLPINRRHRCLSLYAFVYYQPSTFVARFWPRLASEFAFNGQLGQEGSFPPFFSSFSSLVFARTHSHTMRNARFSSVLAAHLEISALLVEIAGYLAVANVVYTAVYIDEIALYCDFFFS